MKTADESDFLILMKEIFAFLRLRGKIRRN